jgi:hypothetical protein
MEILMNFVNELGQPKLMKLTFFDGVIFFGSLVILQLVTSQVL